MNNDLYAFLVSVREAREEKRRCEWRLERLRDNCENITTVLRDTPGGGSGDKHKDTALIALVDAGAELRDRMRFYEERIEAVESFIDGIKDPVSRAILHLRFCACLTWEDVTEELKSYGVWVSERHVYNLRKRAERDADRKWEEEHDHSNG